MRPRILAIIAAAVLILAVAFAVILFRVQETAASSYESQAARWWASAAGGYQDFANQVRSAKPDSSSIPDVCHNAKVQLQNLNGITLAGGVPKRYTDFHTRFMEAVSVNKKYYQRVIDLCSGGGNGTALSGLFSLGKDVEDRYEEAHRLMPEIGANIEPGTYAEVNDRLARIFRPTEQPKEQPQQPKTKVIEVPRKGYSPSFPPAVGSIVIIDTPKRGPLNFREAPSIQSPQIAGREYVDYGERVQVLGREGFWLYVMTSEGTTGYIRWWYDGTPYVRP